MIDTIKIYSKIDEHIYNIIKQKSNIKTMFNHEKKQIYYEIINENLKGSYDSSLSVKVDDGCKYKFSDYVIEIEGSYHKIIKGHNAFDGFFNIQEVVFGLIKIVNNYYDIELPNIDNFYLQRIDITKVFDLNNQDIVKTYINNFRLLNYPKRNLKFYENECVYIPGQTTTLKIYNKLREFISNDRKKVRNFEDFNLIEFENKIKGYIRFECEIRKKKLKEIFGKDKLIKIVDLNYDIFEKVWCDEFMKILKFDYKRLDKVNKKDEVFRRLNHIYKPTKASVLYAFYLIMITDGYKKVKDFTSSSTFYRKINNLINAGIDFSQSDIEIIEKNNTINFDPFNNCLEVC